MSLNKRQAAILDFIEGFLVENQFPPTVREIMKATTITTESVMAYNLNLLDKRGYISKVPRVSRGLKLRRCSDGTPFEAIFRRRPER